MNKEKLKNIIEAALMVSNKPLSLNRIVELFEKDIEEIDRSLLREVMGELQQDYEGRGIELVEVASGYRIQTREEVAEWVNRLFDEKPPRYSRALLETLAIIAYRQPLTRAEIEEIRGVSVSSNIIKTLQEREWIRVVGHKDLPGKPELLATSREFLDYFNLKSLSDLPSLSEIKDIHQLNPDLFDSLAQGEGKTDAALDESRQQIHKMQSLNSDQVTSARDNEEQQSDIESEEKIVPFSNS